MQQVQKNYGRNGVVIHALKDISFTISAGEFVAIMGPSGSGKTTLVNLIGCLDLPDSGTYYLNGEDVTRLGQDALARIRNETIGFVFQGFNLLPRTNALENVETPMIYAGVVKRDRQQRALELLSIFGMADRLDHLPSQLSGGQQQRVAIARALANNPKILLADEPTGNLDTGTGKEVMDILEQLNRTRSVTLIVITHEQEVAERAQRRLNLLDGMLQVSDG